MPGVGQSEEATEGQDTVGREQLDGMVWDMESLVFVENQSKISYLGGQEKAFVAQV